MEKLNRTNWSMERGEDSSGWTLLPTCEPAPGKLRTIISSMVPWPVTRYMNECKVSVLFCSHAPVMSKYDPATSIRPRDYIKFCNTGLVRPQLKHTKKLLNYRTDEGLSRTREHHTFQNLLKKSIFHFKNNAHPKAISLIFVPLTCCFVWPHKEGSFI